MYCLFVQLLCFVQLIANKHLSEATFYGALMAHMYLG